MAQSSIRYNDNSIIGISLVSALGGYLSEFDLAALSGALQLLWLMLHFGQWRESFLTRSLAPVCIADSLLVGRLAGWYGRKPGLIFHSISNNLLQIKPRQRFGARCYALQCANTPGTSAIG